MGLNWIEQAFWIVCVAAILGAYWWAKKAHEHDAARTGRNDRHS